jgi:hypothetical protein
MEVTHRLQPIQDEACQLFAEIEGRGAELEQVVTAAEEHLDGLVNEEIIQEFTEQEVVSQQQVEATRANIQAVEVELPKSE